MQYFSEKIFKIFTLQRVYSSLPPQISYKLSSVSATIGELTSFLGPLDTRWNPHFRPFLIFIIFRMWRVNSIFPAESGTSEMRSKKWEDVQKYNIWKRTETYEKREKKSSCSNFHRRPHPFLIGSGHKYTYPTHGDNSLFSRREKGALHEGKHRTPEHDTHIRTRRHRISRKDIILMKPECTP